MCVQYRGGVHYHGEYHEYRGGISWVPWGDILSTVGDILSTVGDILCTMGVFSTVGDIMINVEGYLEYRVGCSVPWRISWVLWGVILSTEGCSVPWGISWCMWVDIMSTVGCSVTWGKSFVIWVPHGTEHPHGTHDINHMYRDNPPRYSNFKGWYPPTVLNIPMVLNTPTVLKITPTVLMISPPVLNTPMVHKISPTFIMISPTVLKISSHGTHDIPHGAEHPHGTEHPPRYCIHIIQGGYVLPDQPKASFLWDFSGRGIAGISNSKLHLF